MADHELEPGILDVSAMTEQEAQECFQNDPQPILSVSQLRRIGALDAEADQKRVDEQFLASQRANYQAHCKDDLIEELLRRDEAAIREGRQIADGKFAGRLLRDFVRGTLYLADTAELKEGLDTDKRLLVETLLEKLGAEPSDKRQVRLEGSMLGTGETVEEREARIQDIDRNIPTTPRPDVAEAIRENPKRVASHADPFADVLPAPRSLTLEDLD